MKNESLFKKFNQIYDNIYARNDFKDEIYFLNFAKDYHQIKGNKLIDVACGSGGFLLKIIEQGYEVKGIEKSKKMFEIAQKKMPNQTFENADLTKFEGTEEFDILVCLNSAINHAQEELELTRIITNFYIAVKPGGMAIFDSANFDNFTEETASNVVDLYREGDLAIARIRQWKKSEEKNKFDANFLLLTQKGEDVDFEVENNRLKSFKKHEIVAIMQRVGFKVDIYDGFTKNPYTPKSKRGVYVGYKPKE